MSDQLNKGVNSLHNMCLALGWNKLQSLSYFFKRGDLIYWCATTASCTYSQQVAIEIFKAMMPGCDPCTVLGLILHSKVATQPSVGI